MSTLSNYESHKFAAGALALAAHTLFFFLLYFSFNWHVKTPASVMEVERWTTLPDQITEPVPVLPPPPLPEPVLKKAETISVPKAIEPPPQPKAEIEFKDKKKKAQTPPKQVVVPPPPLKKNEPVVPKGPTPEEIAKQKAIEKQRAMALEKLAQQKELDQELADVTKAAKEQEIAQQRRDKMRAEVDAETAKEVSRYKDMIQAKISRNIIMPPDVPDTAEAKFMVIVLPGGAVMDGGVKLLKSSGNAAYDNAAERAIYKAQPLPLPPDVELARLFRELRLSVKP